MNRAEKKDRYYVPEDLYYADFDNSKEFVDIEGFDIPVKLPKMPPKKQMVNYGKSLNQQVFRRLSPPKDLKSWPRLKQEESVEYYYHLREHGQWQIIKGNPVYVPGTALTFFSFWHTDGGGLPKFRMEAIEFFQVWMHIFKDPDCFGMLIIKPRRIGDTEKTLFLMWHICSLYNYSRGGMQNVKDRDAQKNFIRLTNGHKKMIWFFKPVIPERDNPKAVLNFDYPPEILTRKKIEDRKKAGDKHIADDEVFSPVESVVTYESTVLGKYDGQRLTIYHMDEAGKIAAFDVNQQWLIIKPCLALQNLSQIIGKAILTTTVEEKIESERSSIENIEIMWNGSNPNERQDDGRTTTGLYRYFRSARKSAKIDRWGYPMEEDAEKFIKSQIKSLIEIGDYEGAATVRRQYPLAVEDAFQLPPNECVLYPGLLDLRTSQITSNTSATGRTFDEHGFAIKPKAIRGNLVWEKGVFGGSVMFMPDNNGRWDISQHPLKPNHFKMMGNFKSPTCNAVYSIGVDPIDAMLQTKKRTRNAKGKRSDGGCAVYRLYDDGIDGGLEKNNKGDVKEELSHLMETDQFVCDYLYRPDDPEEFYEDIIKTCLYYSAGMHFESQKSSIATYFKGKGFWNYVNKRARVTLKNIGRKKVVTERGMPATPGSIGMYIDALRFHVFHRIGSYHHLRILKDFRAFNGNNRTDRDLTVAAGFALLGAQDFNLKKKVEKHKEVHIDFLRKYQVD
jgi:hypothetical protein